MSPHGSQTVWAGVPDSDELVPESFLRKLAAEMGGAGARPSDPEPRPDVVTEDQEGFDCRIGDRPAKRLRRDPQPVKPRESRRPSPVTVPQVPAGGNVKRKKEKSDSEGQRPAVKPATKPPAKPSVKPSRRAQPPEPSSPGWPASRTPAVWPPGWEVQTHQRSHASHHQRSKHCTYYSPSGGRFSSFKEVQRFCKLYGIPAEEEAGEAEPQEEFDFSPAGLVRWLRRGGQLGKLPASATGPSLACASTRFKGLVHKDLQPELQFSELSTEPAV